MTTRHLVAVFASLTLALPLAGQTLVGVEISGSGPPIVRPFGRPTDAGPCAYPAPTSLPTFLATAEAPCFPVVEFDSRGDVTVDRKNGWIYVGVGFRIARYTLEGEFVDSFETPLQVSCLAANSTNGRLWIAEMGLYGAIEPPPPGTCQATAPVVNGPYLIPYGASWYRDFLTDIDFDPTTSSLIACDGTGRVGSIYPGGNPTPGPFGFFDLGATQGLPGPLTGIAFDPARPGSGVFWVTDGASVAYLEPGGIPASPTPYAPANLQPAPGGNLAGLAATFVPLSFGDASDTSGLGLPVASVQGEALVPSDDFAFRLEGAAPGSTALLAYGNRGPACPGLFVAGIEVLLRPPVRAFATAAVAADGTAFLPAPIPETLPPGTQVVVQWLVATPGGDAQATQGLEVVFSKP